MIEAHRIYQNKKMTADLTPLLLMRAMFDALCRNFVEPTYLIDVQPADDVAATMLAANSRASLIVNFTYNLMSAVAV